MIPASLTTERIKAAINLVTLINCYVRLKKTGKRHTGLCPFHREKTPSFTVDPTKQRWRCYACGAWGDCYDFVRRIEGVDFKTSKRRLAEMAGISLEADKLSPEESRQWAAERHAIEQHLPAAKLWQRAGLVLGGKLLES